MPLQPLGIFIAVDQICELVAKNRHAARLEAHDWNPLLDSGPHGCENLTQESFGDVQHAVIVERPSTTKALTNHANLIPGVLQHFDGGLRDFWREVIVERVGPKNHRRLADVARLPARKPILEGLRRERRDLTLLGVTRGELSEVRKTRSLCKEVCRRGHGRS